MHVDELICRMTIAADNLEQPLENYTNTYRKFLKNGKVPFLTAEDALKRGAPRDAVEVVEQARKELTQELGGTEKARQLAAEMYPFEFLLRIAY